MRTSITSDEFVTMVESLTQEPMVLAFARTMTSHRLNSWVGDIVGGLAGFTSHSEAYDAMKAHPEARAFFELGVDLDNLMREYAHGRLHVEDGYAAIQMSITA